MEVSTMRLVLERVAAYDAAFELLQRRDDGLRTPFQRRLADAIDALVRIELDEDEIRAGGVGDEDLLAGDPHGGPAAGRRSRCRAVATVAAAVDVPSGLNAEMWRPAHRIPCRHARIVPRSPLREVAADPAVRLVLRRNRPRRAKLRVETSSRSLADSPLPKRSPRAQIPPRPQAGVGDLPCSAVGGVPRSDRTFAISRSMSPRARSAARAPWRVPASAA